jgi:hypothetical protein
VALRRPARDDPANLPGPGHDSDALTDDHLRAETSDAPDREKALLVDVRDDQPDLVDVPQHGQGWRIPAGHADVGRAEHVCGHLAVGRRGLAPNAGRLGLVAGGATRPEERFEELWDGHGPQSRLDACVTPHLL